MTTNAEVTDAIDAAEKAIFPEGVDPESGCYITTRLHWYCTLDLVREQAAQVVEREVKGDDGKRVASLIRAQR